MKILSIYGFRGGNGKTTIAVNLAYWLAKLRKRVLIVDSDFHAPAMNDFLAKYCDFDEKKMSFPQYLIRIGENISNVVRRARVNDVAFDVLLSGEPKKINFNELGTALYPGTGRAAIVQTERIENGLHELDRKMHYDYAIIDTTPGLMVQSLNITLAISDLLIMILRNAEIDFLQATAYLIHRIRSSFDDKEKQIGVRSKLCFIINEAIHGEERLYKGYIEEHKMDEEILGVLPFSPALRKYVGIFSAKDENHEWARAAKSVVEKIIEKC